MIDFTKTRDEHQCDTYAHAGANASQAPVAKENRHVYCAKCGKQGQGEACARVQTGMVAEEPRAEAPSQATPGAPSGMSLEL
jgi:hypothetical protein